MQRSLKNILMILLVGLVGCSMVYTLSYAKDHTTSNEISNMSREEHLEKLNDNEQQDDSNMETPPDKLEGDNQENSENKASANNEEKPSNESNMEMPPAKPEGENNTANISYVYYIIFGIESLILSILIVYLVMSVFNKKAFKEVFINKDKIIIYVLITIILTYLMTYLNIKVLNNNLNIHNDINNNQSNNTNISYKATTEIKEDTTITSGTYESTTKDENAILVSGEVEATISNITVNKEGDSNGGDNTSFYGTNSAIIAKDKANLTIDNITVNTNATGANGVFSYGGSATTNNSSSDGTAITIKNSKITTSKDNSGGIMTTGGGIMNAYNLDITTSGTSSAAIRTDRGGGTVNVDGGTYTTTGQGSPTIYSTAKITVSNATLTAKSSEGIVIEGKNSVSINSCTLTDTNNKLNGKSTTYKNIFLYQSMSGDAEVGDSTFSATNSNIITNNGDTFYITNTSAIINLTNNTITNNDNSGNFLRAMADSWGTEGSNGGNVVLNMTKQNVIGNIIIDSISTLEMNMSDNSYFEGMINNTNDAKSIKLTLDSSSTIKLTKDSYITELVNADTTNSNIEFNGYKLYVNGKVINN